METLARHRSRALPFLLHNSVQTPGGKGVAPVSQALYQLRLPVLDRLNTTMETCVLPPISLSLSTLIPVSAFPGLFQHLVGVPFGWPYSDAPLNGALIPDPPLAPLNLAPLLSLLRVLPFFSPPSVRNKVTSYLQGESGCYYTLDAIIYILEKSMRPGTKKTDGDIENTYSWPLNWEMPNLTSDLCKGLSTYHPEIFQLLTSLGRRFIAKFLIALLAADGHFLTLLLSTLWGLRGGFTTLCLQGIFGSGKTYCASMMLVVATSILGIPTLLTAEPNLPLYTAADTICDLLREASESTRRQYARLLAQNIPVSTSIDYGQEDRANLFQENSPLRCVIITQGGLLRQLCHAYSPLSTFIKKVRLAFNDESQQGGKAGFTVIGANLPCSCLQCLTGGQEQTKAGTGGEKLQEALVDQLAHKAIGFLGGSKPHLPSSMIHSLFQALRTAQASNLPQDRDSPFDLLQYLCDSSLPLSCLPATVWEAEGMVPTAGVTLHLILPHSLRCPADTYFTRWPCIILIFSTPMAKLWPLAIMKIRSLTNSQPNSPPTSKTFPTIVRGIVFSIGLPACRRGATDFLQTMWSLSSKWLRRSLSTWLDRSAAIKKAPSCSSLLHTTIRSKISLMPLASLRTTFLPHCTNSTSL